MDNKITVEALLDEVQKLALDKPDTEAGCYYTNKFSPCCIVGHGLFNLGVSLQELKDDFEGYGAGSIFTGSNHADWVKGARVGDVNLEALKEIQNLQDYGDKWGDALLEAREEWPDADWSKETRELEHDE